MNSSLNFWVAEWSMALLQSTSLLGHNFMWELVSSEPEGHWFDPSCSLLSFFTDWLNSIKLMYKSPISHERGIIFYFTLTCVSCPFHVESKNKSPISYWPRFKHPWLMKEHVHGTLFHAWFLFVCSIFLSHFNGKKTHNISENIGAFVYCHFLSIMYHVPLSFCLSYIFICVIESKTSFIQIVRSKLILSKVKVQSVRSKFIQSKVKVHYQLISMTLLFIWEVRSHDQPPWTCLSATWKVLTDEW